MKRNALLAVAVATAVGGAPVSLGGCPSRVERAGAAPTAAALLAHLRARAAEVRTLRTEAKVDYLAGKGERLKLTMSFLVERPGRLRVDAESPVGGSTVMTLASDGRDFQLLDARDNRFLAGVATPCSLGQLLRVRLSAADLGEVLTGGAPLLGEPVGVGWNPADGGRDVLTLRGPNGERETVQLAAAGQVWDVLSVEVTGADGKLQYRLTHDGWSGDGAAGGLRFPSTSRIEEPARDGDARIRYRSREVNVALPATAFHLEAPTGMAVEGVRCDDAG